MLFLSVFFLFVDGIRGSAISNDDVIPMLHLATHYDHSVVDVSFAAFTAAADRSEQLVRLALQEVRRSRVGKARKIITRNDVLSAAVRNFIAPEDQAAKKAGFDEAMNSKQTKETVAFVAGGMDLLLLFVSYIMYPMYHCQPILILYWWIGGTIIMMFSQGLSMGQAFIMLAQISTTIGYGSSTPTTAGLKFFHAVHAFTGLTAGVGDALDSIADYLIITVDHVFGAAHSDSRDSAYAKGCTDHYSHEMKINAHKQYNSDYHGKDYSAWDIVSKSKNNENTEDGQKQKAVAAKWTIDEVPDAAVLRDGDNWQDHYTEMAKVQCSREILERRIHFRILSLVVFSALTTCYLMMDFENNKTREKNGELKSPSPEKITKAEEADNLVEKYGERMNFGQQLGNALYTTIITFTTVGYGDINPYSSFSQIVSPIVLHAVVHDFGLFQSVIFQYNHDKPSKAWAPDGLDYKAGADVDHNSADHDMGVTNCPLYSKKYPNLASSRAGSGRVQSYAEAEAQALTEEANVKQQEETERLHLKMKQEGFEDPHKDEKTDYFITPKIKNGLVGIIEDQVDYMEGKTVFVNSEVKGQGQATCKFYTCKKEGFVKQDGVDNTDLHHLQLDDFDARDEICCQAANGVPQ